MPHWALCLVSFTGKLLSGNEILTIIFGRNSVVNLQKLTRNHPNLDLVNTSAYAELGQIPLICSQVIGNNIFIITKDHNRVVYLRKLICNNPNLDLIRSMHMQNLIKFHLCIY